jgi:predicted permease
VEAEIDAELRSHLEMAVEDAVRAGMSEDEARRAARVRFGNPVVMRERTVGADAALWVEGLWRDLKHGVRTLMRSPGFSVMAIAVMALGIGATVALFAVVHAVLMRRLPYKNPQRLVALYGRSDRHAPTYGPLAPGDFYAWQREARGFQQMALWHWSGFNLSNANDEPPQFVNAGAGSWNLFATLGVQPALGRLFAKSDDSAGAAPTAVLSWSFFKSRFNGNPKILGRSIRLNGRPYTILGVLPEWFHFPGAKIALWVPIHTEQSAATLASYGEKSYWVVGRLKNGVSEEAALRELNAVQERIHREYSDEDPAYGVDAKPLKESIVGNVQTPLLVLLAAVGCLLLIACLNFSNLLLARATARQRETAIRAALGGNRWQLCREQLVESLLLSCAGGFAGLLVAAAAMRWIIHLWQGLPRVANPSMGFPVLLFAGGVMLLSGVLSGLAPALSVTRKGLLANLQDASRLPGRSVLRASTRKSLLAIEIGLTVVLLVCAGLLLQSFLRLSETPLGCSTRNILTMEYHLRGEKYAKPDEIVNFETELLERVRHLPGVRSVGLTNILPGDGLWPESEFSIPNEQPVTPGHYDMAPFRTASPGYFSTIGIPLLRGRSFRKSERLKNDGVIVVNEAFARKYFAGKDAIGQEVEMNWDAGPEKYRVVGLVGNTRFSLHSKLGPAMYFPILSGRHDMGNDAVLVVRTEAGASAWIGPLKRAIAAVDPSLPVHHVVTMRQIVKEGTNESRLDVLLVMCFGMVSLVLASVGLYGVLTYLATQRATEIGIRMALGAQREEVLRLMLRDGLGPAVAGLGMGLVVSAFVTRWIDSLLYKTQPLDPVVFLLVAATLLGVAALACAGPAWRASRMDPMRALRME